jgi:hypothetical protein
VNCLPIRRMRYSTLLHERLALKRIGWRHDRTLGSHKIMKKDGWADYPFSFHDSEELGPAGDALFYFGDSDGAASIPLAVYSIGTTR